MAAKHDPIHQYKVIYPFACEVASTIEVIDKFEPDLHGRRYPCEPLSVATDQIQRARFQARVEQSRLVSNDYDAMVSDDLCGTERIIEKSDPDLLEGRVSVSKLR